jgi:hypothetical protein
LFSPTFFRIGGELRREGTASWYLYGDATPWLLAGGVVCQGNTSFNHILNTESVNTSITIAEGAESARYDYNDYQLAAGSAMLPVLTPRNNPGSHWWTSNLDELGFTVNLASPAPAGGVAFSVHLQS